MIKNEELRTNIGVKDEAVIPNSYIITYKSSATPGGRKKHEETINKKAKSNGKEGVIETIDLDGFKGYVAKITSSELKDVVNSNLVASIEKDGIVITNETAAVGLNLTIVAGLFGHKPIPTFSPETINDETCNAHAEYGADTMAGLHTVRDIPWSEEYQSRVLEMSHPVFDRVESVVGEQVWNFADFQTPSSFIFRVDGNKQGAFTWDRRPKSVVQVLKKRWTEMRARN
ncbi:hypothetical protein EDB82DRAFT_473474 [Fusarium venenatum]|uniref:uncharacterized protein n=1 Tax=Fusarium venenatum TaxID=56646 RepID=UPI001E15B9A4|nr:hypothetical protein EDB82DRAFT_473474 [Fusarium venenatum]